VIVKDDRGKHIAVLGDGQRRHLETRGLIEHLVYAAGTIEQRILGVHMKMNERLVSHCVGRAPTWRRAASRYYSGVRILRTTISCVAVAIFTAAPHASIRAAGLTFPLQAQWTTTLVVPPGFPPAYDAAQAYVALRNSQLVAVSLETGQPAWSVECPVSAAPAAGDGLVFVGGDGFLRALAQGDGAQRWRTPLDGTVASVHWDTGWLIATTDRGALLAIRAADGEVLWRRDLASGLQSAPAPTGDRLYLSLQSGVVMALALQTGDLVWTAQLPKPGAGILAIGDRLFIGSLDNKFYCLSTKKGDVVWSWRTGADVIGMPAIDLKRVYFVSLDNVLRALDRKSGSIRWMKSLPMRPSAGPLLSGTTLIAVGVSSELHAYSVAAGLPLGDLVLKSAQGQEMQLAAPPHLTADDLLIILMKGGQMQAMRSAPPPAPAAPPAPLTPTAPPASP
jgi:outer membrane protein assembly factor BamB